MSPEDNLHNHSNSNDCPPDAAVNAYKKQRKKDGNKADSLKKSSNKAKTQDFLSRKDKSSS